MKNLCVYYSRVAATLTPQSAITVCPNQRNDCVIEHVCFLHFQMINYEKRSNLKDYLASLLVDIQTVVYTPVCNTRYVIHRTISYALCIHNRFYLQIFDKLKIEFLLISNTSTT